MKRLGIAVVVVLFLTGCGAARSQMWRKSVAVTVSVGCEAADLATSMYAFGQRTGVELNPLLAGVQDDPLRFAARKVALAAPAHVWALWLWDRQPVLARMLLYGNGAMKCWVASRNDRLREVR